jgi:hypothetical protein
MPSNQVLFLDFDGVLHPAGAHRNRGDLSRLPLLEAMLREPAHASVAVVISSTWRHVHSIAQLRSLFSEDIRARILDITPMPDEYDSEHERYEEIKAWLDHHAQVTSWAALDDDVEGFPAHRRKNVVFTDPNTGLSNANLESLRRLLA